MQKIKKGLGENQSERYLISLCNKSFLSLWSYPNVYRKESKELCDLLVIFGSDILIFSDKNCKYPKTKNDNLNWSRWFNRAVKHSAEQLWKAENWIRNHPGEIYLDAKCSYKIPLDLNFKGANIHLIAVARGASKSCRRYFDGGSGSLMLRSDLQGIDNHQELFTIGDLDPKKTFIHVLDDTTLDIVMGGLDTISDFVSYISKKEALLRSEKYHSIMVAGEEELLPQYLANMKNGEHNFDFPEDANILSIGEGEWDDFNKNPQRTAQIEEDKISYVWDDLIDRFGHNALNGTQYYVTKGGFKDSEKILRFLAAESRFKRRLLSKALFGLVVSTPENLCGRRYIMPFDQSGVHYVFVTFPLNKKYSMTENRKTRSEYLRACCMVYKKVHQEATDIIGIATESGNFSEYRSEDALYLDASEWSEEQNKEAERIQEELQILIEPDVYAVKDKEFPSSDKSSSGRVGKNDPCPCGSGLNFGKCHSPKNKFSNFRT